MGCPNFFKYHPSATIEDYAKRFGYNTEVLKSAVKRTKEYEISKNRYGGNERVAMTEAVLALDTNSATDALYMRENSIRFSNSNNYTSLLAREVVKSMVKSSQKAHKTHRLKSKNLYIPTSYSQFAIQETFNYMQFGQLLSRSTSLQEYRKNLYGVMTGMFERMMQNIGDEEEREGLVEEFIKAVSRFSEDKDKKCCVCGEPLGKNYASKICDICVEFITKLISENMNVDNLEKIISEDQLKFIKDHFGLGFTSSTNSDISLIV
jgi:hypothetical protein